MSKKIQDPELKQAWHCYAVGNFHAARAFAKRILSIKDNLASNKEQAASIITMTGVDTWALLIGALVLLFVILIGFLVAY